MSALAELSDPTLLPARVSRVHRGVCSAMTGTAKVRVVAERGVEVAVPPGGGLLIDTPGMRALSVVGAGEGVGGEQGCAPLRRFPRARHPRTASDGLEAVPAS